MKRTFALHAWLCLCLFCCLFTPVKGQQKHVILISIDGLHPDMYLDPAWPVPNLHRMMKEGFYADHMLSVLPSFTYPAHTAMITGALPARSGIYFNQPLGNHGEWYWDAKAIKTPTLWQALKAQGLTTAALEWPVTLNAVIDWNLPEVWDAHYPDDHISLSRKVGTAGLAEEMEINATGRLDSVNMDETTYSLDENLGRMAAYILKAHQPAFMAVHLNAVDNFEHRYGRDADSVRMAIAVDDRVIGNIIQAVNQSGIAGSTTIIVVGDHGFSNINTVCRPNLLLTNMPEVKFYAAGGAAFLYVNPDLKPVDTALLLQKVTDSLNRLPTDKRKLFRIVNRGQLRQMGADSAALLGLFAEPGLVFSGSVMKSPAVNHGPGTSIQQNKLDGVFIPTHGGHHGYDPVLPEMYTGFIVAGAGIRSNEHIDEIRVVDIAPLIARLLQIQFDAPDGKLIERILK